MGGAVLSAAALGVEAEGEATDVVDWAVAAGTARKSGRHRRETEKHRMVTWKARWDRRFSRGTSVLKTGKNGPL
jgi:hypothetical protein